MRVGSFLVEKDGRRADISIIPLGGASGGELANVNRWRNQLGLDPVDDSKLAADLRKITVAGKPASLYDLVGTDPQSKQPTRIVGAILPMGDATWYFKMTGNDALVAEEKPKFEAFLNTVKFEAPHGAGASANPHAGLGIAASGLVPAPDSGVTASEKPAWELPQGWQEQPPSSMRLASFAVTGEGGAKADVSVIRLSGIAGGNLANVNRWRQQVGLPPVEESELAKLLEKHEANGASFFVADMAGQSMESGHSSRLVAAIVPRGGMTWFYKMFGDDQLVARQKAAFIKFVESARYPNAS
jgi:hypothetical protein